MLEKIYPNRVSTAIAPAALILLLMTTPGCAQDEAETPAMDAVTRAALDAAIAGGHRSEQNSARDRYRKPVEVLEFLGFRSDMTVVEIWPGGGWYTEVLAPALKERGKLYAAQYSPNPRYAYQRRYFGAFLTKTGENPDVFRDVEITALRLPDQLRPREPRERSI